MRTHRRSGLLISKFALQKLFRYLITCAGVTRQNRDFVEIDFVESLPFLLQTPYSRDIIVRYLKIIEKVIE